MDLFHSLAWLFACKTRLLGTACTGAHEVFSRRRNRSGFFHHSPPTADCGPSQRRAAVAVREKMLQPCRDDMIAPMTLTPRIQKHEAWEFPGRRVRGAAPSGPNGGGTHCSHVGGRVERPTPLNSPQFYEDAAPKTFFYHMDGAENDLLRKASPRPSITRLSSSVRRRKPKERGWCCQTREPSDKTRSPAPLDDYRGSPI